MVRRVEIVSETRKIVRDTRELDEKGRASRFGASRSDKVDLGTRTDFDFAPGVGALAGVDSPWVARTK